MDRRIGWEERLSDWHGMGLSPTARKEVRFPARWFCSFAKSTLSAIAPTITGDHYAIVSTTANGGRRCVTLLRAHFLTPPATSSGGHPAAIAVQHCGRLQRKRPGPAPGLPGQPGPGLLVPWRNRAHQPQRDRRFHAARLPQRRGPLRVLGFSDPGLPLPPRMGGPGVPDDHQCPPGCAPRRGGWTCAAGRYENLADVVTVGRTLASAVISPRLTAGAKRWQGTWVFRRMARHRRGRKRRFGGGRGLCRVSIDSFPPASR